MKAVGIVAEYNPFHSGHRDQIRKIREIFGAETPVAAVMSGDFVQRGEAASYDKFTRAEAAVRGGVSLVIELPLPWSLSSAESFARGGVGLLGAAGVIDALSFGSESGDLSALENTAAVLDTPNDLLAVEYIRAAAKLGYIFDYTPVRREGSTHDGAGSASELRALLRAGESLAGRVPGEVWEVLRRADETGRGFVSPLEIYAPKREEKVNMANPASSFNLEYAYIGAVFRTDQQVYDDSYMIVPLSLARSLFNYDKEVTAVELKVKDSGDIAPVKKEIQRILGDQYIVHGVFQAGDVFSAFRQGNDDRVGYSKMV